jgi:peroxin-3
LDETADLIESPTFSYVLTLLNNEAFSMLVDQKCATDAFRPSTSAPETAPQSFESVATVVPLAAAERKTKLANLLAVLARQAHVIGNGTHPPNEYLNALDQNVRELEAFSAVVYSSNFDLETLGAKEKTESSTVNDADSASSSYAPVMVDTEETASSSVPVLVDNDQKEEVESEAQQEGVESSFEQAWGKATSTE